MRALITGGSGFVGPYLKSELESRLYSVAVLDHKCDLTQPDQVESHITPFLANGSGDSVTVFHLAALSHVGMSWQSPSRYVEVNIGGTVNLLKMLSDAKFQGKFVFVSSAEVYGKSDTPRPISESTQANPLSPYAASKLAAESFVMQYSRAYDFHAVVARPFNHIGPNQLDKFLVPAIAKRIVTAQRANVDTIDVGNLDAVRDFLDVRDVVGAYVDLAERSNPGEIYNVCSGKGTIVRKLVETMIEISGYPLRLQVNPDLVRPIEVEYLVGDNTKIAESINFVPKFDLAATLSDVLKFWRDQLELV